jgi:hypothetical protein
MGTAANVLVGAKGKVYGAVTGTTLPTTTAASLAAFTDLGYVSEDGVVQSLNEDTSEIKAWGGDTVRTVQTGHTLRISALTFIETNPETLKAYYGSANFDDVTNRVEIKSPDRARGKRG